MPPNGYVFEYEGAIIEHISRVHPIPRRYHDSAAHDVRQDGHSQLYLYGKSLAIHFTSENRLASATDPVDSTVALEHRPQ